MKICSKCKEEKDFSEFYKQTGSNDGLRCQCKTCISEQNKKWRLDNKEYVSIKNKEYRNNPEFKELIKIRSKEYRDNPINKETQKQWMKDNKDKVLEYKKKYLKSEGCKIDRMNWYRRFKSRKPYVLAWRSVLTNTLKRFNKNKESETIELLGYSALQLKDHITNLFTEGMSWENYGEWHIDHIKPVSLFDPETPINIVNALENLRPLWAFDNLSKGNKYKK